MQVRLTDSADWLEVKSTYDGSWYSIICFVPPYSDSRDKLTRYFTNADRQLAAVSVSVRVRPSRIQYFCLITCISSVVGCHGETRSKSGDEITLQDDTALLRCRTEHECRAAFQSTKARRHDGSWLRLRIAAGQDLRRFTK